MSELVEARGSAREQIVDAAKHGEILTRTVERLSTASELTTITETVAAAARAIAGSDGATFVLREDERCFYVDEDAIGHLWKGQKFPLEACISGWSMMHREVVVLPDIYVDPRIPADAYRPTFVKSLCMVPIRAADPIGALGCYWRTPHTATAEEVRMLQVIANSAAVALENLELRSAVVRRSVERDSLASRKQELESAIHSLVHDLRSPLGVMMGFAQLLEDNGENAATRDMCSRSILDSGGQLLRQIDRMLALYRITNRPIEPVPLDLSAIAHELAGRAVQSQPIARGRLQHRDRLAHGGRPRAGAADARQSAVQRRQVHWQEARRAHRARAPRPRRTAVYVLRQRQRRRLLAE
jgi:K+-sensing histidine kinase KdpD